MKEKQCYYIYIYSNTKQHPSFAIEIENKVIFWRQESFFRELFIYICLLDWKKNMKSEVGARTILMFWVIIIIKLHKNRTTCLFILKTVINIEGKKYMNFERGQNTRKLEHTSSGN